MAESLGTRPTVLDAIVHHWLPEHVDRWLRDHGEDYVSEDLRDGHMPTWEAVVEQVMEAHPVAMTEAELNALPLLVPESLRHQIRYRIHCLIVEARPQRHAGRR